MRTLILFCLLLLAPIQAQAEDAALAKLFAEAGIRGTMVISPLAEGAPFVHDAPRASRRFPAASTFKILNTLIALEENAIAETDILKWDGVSRDLPEWNRDQTLESAFRSSCVWCYQTLARRVGGAKYRHYLAQAAYGELHPPFDETSFWLDGSLTISASEQVEFLKKVYRRALPFKDSSYETLRRIMLSEQNAHYALRAKTGWATRIEQPIGWYVGYLETRQGTWAFAMNIDTPTPATLPLRQELTRAALRAKGLIE
jgi:beta-lactamase class D